MNIPKNPKAVALVATVLFVASLFALLNTRSVNGTLKSGLKEEKLRSEALLSEKLLLEKELAKFKEQIQDLKGNNGELNSLFKQVSEKLESQQSEFSRLRKENATLSQIRKQRQQLAELQHRLQNELQNLRTSYATLEARNVELTSTVATLEERNKRLNEDLNRAMFASVDQSQLQALKGKKQKLTVKAKRTSKLVANFEIPSNLDNLSFRIIDPDGNVLSQQDGSIVSTSTPSESTLTASSDKETTGSKLQKVEMTYIPNSKMRSGLYTIEILNDNLYVSALKLRMR